jgi:RNA polymerase-binding transcription factor DksA
MLSAEFIARMKAALIKERTEVENDIREMSVPDLALDNPELDDLAQDAVEDILQGSSLAVLNALLLKINKALDRIEDGSYGRDVDSGEFIPEELLIKEPWAEKMPPIAQHKSCDCDH